MERETKSQWRKENCGQYHTVTRLNLETERNLGHWPFGKPSIDDLEGYYMECPQAHRAYITEVCTYAEGNHSYAEAYLVRQACVQAQRAHPLFKE